MSLTYRQTPPAARPSAKPFLSLALTPRDRLILALLPAVLALLLFLFHLQPVLAEYVGLRDQFAAYPPPDDLRAEIDAATALATRAQAELADVKADLDARRAALPPDLPPFPPPPALDRLHAFNDRCAAAHVRILSATREADAFSPADYPALAAVSPALPSDAAPWRFVLLATYAQLSDLLAANAAAPSTTLPCSLDMTTPPAPGQPARWALHLLL